MYNVRKRFDVDEWFYIRFRRLINSGLFDRLTVVTSFLIKTLLSSISIILSMLIINQWYTLRNKLSGNFFSILLV